MKYTPVTDIEIGDSIYKGGLWFVVTNVEEVEDDWAGERPIGADTLIEITLDAEGTFRFSKSESLFVSKP